MTKKVRLPDVTLLTVTSIEIEDAVEALKISSCEIEFAAVKLVAPERPGVLPAGFDFVSIPPMDFLGYSRFMLADLHRCFDTSHCLVVQSDGFVVNPGCWRDEFLQYDYIGAPWPESVQVVPDNWTLQLNRNRVGNGGFSLRSHTLTECSAHIDFDALDFPLKSEDLVICHFLYEEMRAQGIVFAPPALAAVFSIESPESLYGQDIDAVFGFHGKHWVPEAVKRLPAKAFAEYGVLPAGRVPAAQIKPGRNELCPCGSGMKFKRCHGV